MRRDRPQESYPSTFVRRQVSPTIVLLRGKVKPILVPASLQGAGRFGPWIPEKELQVVPPRSRLWQISGMT